jgi:hypothetical protein
MVSAFISFGLGYCIFTGGGCMFLSDKCFMAGRKWPMAREKKEAVFARRFHKMLQCG